MSIATVSINGKLLGADGRPPGMGKIVARLSQPARVLDGAIGDWLATTEVLGTVATDGTVTLALVPNDVLTPAGTVYELKFSVIAADGTPVPPWTETVLVPTSASPIAIGDLVRVAQTGQATFVAGPKGDTGERGATGSPGNDGTDGTDGAQGSPGISAPAPIFADTTTGLAGTAEGSYFSVPSASAGESYILYRKTSGAAVLAKRFPMALQNVYADSVNGNDANDGLTKATAKATINAAIALLTSDFGTLWLARGSRFKESVGVTLSRYTDVRAYGGGERPIIDGSRSLLNAGFSAVDGYANVYEITVDFAALGFFTMPGQLYSQSFFQFFEGAPGHDTRFTYANGFFNWIQSWVGLNTDDATRLAYVRDNPGTFHVRKSDGSPVPTDTTTNPGTVFLFYVHLPDSGNPITNGKEYSVSGCEPTHWIQTAGGSIEDVWLTRSGHRNGCQFEGGTMRRCLVDQYPVHGGFWNSMYVEDSESDGTYRAGACFHGFRNTSTRGSDRGNTFVRCTAKNGAWAFYSHGTGVANPQLFWKLTDCVTEHVVVAYWLVAVQGVTCLRGKNRDCVVAISWDGGVGAAGYVFTDTSWIITSGAEDSASYGVFDYATATLNNCFIGGGKAGMGYRLSNSNGDIYLNNTTITCANDVLATTNTHLHLVNSAVPAAFTAALIASATQSSVPGVALDATGTCAANGSITGCFSPRRTQSAARTMVAQGAGGWVTFSNGQGMNWIFTAGSADVEVDTSGGPALASIGPNSVVRIPNYDGAGNDFIAKWVSSTGNFYGTNKHKITFATPAAASCTKAGITSLDQLRATCPVWPKTAASMYCRPDADGSGAAATVTLYGTASEVALVVAGTPLKFLFDNGDRFIDAGVYFVQSVTADAGGPRVLLDRRVVYPVPFSILDWQNYKGYDDKNWGDGSWMLFHAMPRLEVRLPAGKQNRSVFKITLPSGLELTPNARGYLPLYAVTTSPPTQTNYVDSPWHGFVDDVTVEPQTAGEATGVATIAMEQYLFSTLEPRWLQAEESKVRHAPDSYLSGKGVGCTL